MLFLLIPFFVNAQSPVPSGAVLETLIPDNQQNIAWSEGPVWKNGVLLFSDVQNNKINQWNETSRTVSVYLTPTNKSNGLTVDAQGRLLLAQGQTRTVSRQEINGTMTLIATKFRGKTFNSPNDLVVRNADGSIFFTDPDYDNSLVQKFRGIYRVSPSGAVQLIDSLFQKPNGICFSPDEKKLYVDDSPLRQIYVWDVVNDSTFTNKQLLFTTGGPSNVDGMKTDAEGNIYCTGDKGIWIISPNGEYLDKILTPSGTTPTNCNWGDSDMKTLYITTQHGLHRIRLASTNAVKGQGSLIPPAFELFTNYPNPFNPSTTIKYNLPKNAKVRITIFDLLGREVEKLMDQEQDAGYRTITWNTQMSSGMYFYRLEAISTNNPNTRFVQVKKLMLLK